MAKTKTKPDLSQKVLKRIKNKKIKMKPRLFFVLGSVLLGLGLVGAIGLAILFTNLSFFHLRVLGPFGFLGLGRFGLSSFLITFPWLPLLITLATLGSGLLILRRYDFSYQKNFFYLVLIVLIVVLGFGFALDQLGLNERLGRAKTLPPLVQPRFTNHNWAIGQVVALEGESLTLLTPNQEEITVNLSSPLKGNLILGDQVRVVGQWQEDVFEAQAIRKCGLHWRFKENRVKGSFSRPGLR